MQRRGRANALQMVIFAMAIMLMLLLSVVRSSLIGQWQAQLPIDAPNHFLLNLAPEEKPVLEGFFREQGVATEASVATPCSLKNPSRTGFSSGARLSKKWFGASIGNCACHCPISEERTTDSSSMSMIAMAKITICSALARPRRCNPASATRQILPAKPPTRRPPESRPAFGRAPRWRFRGQYLAGGAGRIAAAGTC